MDNDETNGQATTEQGDQSDVTVETEVTTEDTTVNTDTTDDPLDSITNVDELRNKAKGYRATASRYKKDKKPEPTLNVNSSSEMKQTNQFGDIVSVVSAVKGLENDELEKLSSDARELGLEPIKYIQSAPGKARLNEFRKDRQSKEAAPNIGSKSPVFKKHTQEDLGKMSVADLEKILPHAE